MKLPVFISEKMFYAISGSRSNYISIEQLSTFLCNLYYGSFEETAKCIFQIYDFDLDGYIKPKDVKLLFCYLPFKGDKTLIQLFLHGHSHSCR